MYFREKKLARYPYKTFELIRWHYEGGTTRAVILGRVKDDATQIPDDVLARMTPAEREEAMAWWRAHVDAKRAVSVTSMARCHRQVAYVQRAIDEGLMTPDLAASIHADLDRIAAILKKAGYKRPKRAPKLPAVDVASKEF